MLAKSQKAEDGIQKMAEASRPPLPETSLAATGWSYRYVFRGSAMQLGTASEGSHYVLYYEGLGCAGCIGMHCPFA